MCGLVAEEGGGKLSQLGKPTDSHWELQASSLPSLSAASSRPGLAMRG